MDKRNYHIYHDGRFMRLDEYFSNETRNNSSSSVQDIWSARLSTGLFGTTYCSSGNRGPKSSTEVLLASGDEGLIKLIDLGFITCPTCKPEETEGFWKVAGPAVEKKYGKEYDIHCLDDFVNRNILPFDARRVNWETIVPVIGAFPGRLYVPQGFKVNDLLTLEIRLRKLNQNLPDIGYLDKSIQPWQFVSYRQ